MPQTSPMSWTNIILLSIIMIIFTKSAINWSFKMKQTKEKLNKPNMKIKWKF